MNLKATFLTKKLLEIAEQCKGVHCVDLGKSFPTHSFLQKLASIQPITSLVKFARSPRKPFRAACFPFETLSGSLLLLAFCEFSFGPVIIIITDPPGLHPRR